MFTYLCFFSSPHNYDVIPFSPFLQGITTYEYVVAMRTQSEPPGSGDGGDQQSSPSSPASSAVTAMSGRSSVGMGLQYKGAWCTPPRIFMDHQVTVIRRIVQFILESKRKTISSYVRTNVTNEGSTNMEPHCLGYTRKSVMEIVKDVVELI